MKRIKRNPEKFEPIELYAALARDQGYVLNAPAHQTDFIDRVDRSIKAAADNSALIHGKRVEAMFAHVAGGLGSCALIKQEDSGNVFAENEELQAPDYKIILKSGEQFFVEVKNCHFDKPTYLYPIAKEYDGKLQKYAELHRTPLKYAIFYSRWNKWTLLPRDSLTNQKNRYVTDMVNSLARNEMLSLGDRMIGTKPDLVFELRADPRKDVTLNQNGRAHFAMGDVRMYCDGRMITDAKEKSIAFYLMRFGDWIEGDTEGVFEDNRLVGVRYAFNPHSFDRTQGFSVIGTLSSMISSAYSELTIHENKVIALDIKQNPEIFAPEIPLDLKGTILPLWQFLIQPNANPIERKVA